MPPRGNLKRKVTSTPPIPGGGRTGVSVRMGKGGYTLKGGAVAFVSNYLDIYDGMVSKTDDLVRSSLRHMRDRIEENMNKQNNLPSKPGETAYPRHRMEGLQGSFEISLKSVTTFGREGMVGVLYSRLNYAYYLEYGATGIFGVPGLRLSPRPTMKIAYQQSLEKTKMRMNSSWGDLRKAGKVYPLGSSRDGAYPDIVKLRPVN